MSIVVVLAFVGSAVSLLVTVVRIWASYRRLSGERRLMEERLERLERDAVLGAESSYWIEVKQFIESGRER